MGKHPPNRLGDLMLLKGVSRRDLAVELDVTEATIERFEKNKGGPIPSKYQPALVAIFETTADHLMGYDREPGQPHSQLELTTRSGGAA